MREDGTSRRGGTRPIPEGPAGTPDSTLGEGVLSQLNPRKTPGPRTVADPKRELTCGHGKLTYGHNKIRTSMAPVTFAVEGG